MSAGTATDRSLAVWIFLFLCCVYLVTFSGHFYTGDGIEMFKTTESLVLRQDLAVLPGITGRAWGYEGADGRRYSPYALGLSVVQAPLFAAAHLVTAPLPLSLTARARLTQAAAMSANLFVTSATAVMIFLIARTLGFGRRPSGTVALLYGLSTMAWVYGKHDFAEPLAGLALLGAAAFLLREDPEVAPGRRAAGPTGAEIRDLAMAGAFNGFGFFTKYQMVLYTPILLAFLIGRARRRGEAPRALAARAACFLAPGLLFGLVNLFVNHARFGTWLQTGYANQGEIFAGFWFYPAGLFGLLLSPGKGIVWYSPLVIAAPFAWRAFHRRHRDASLLCGGIVLATFLLFGPLWWWHGDWAWGPRYLIVAVPYLVLPLVAWLDERAAAASRIAGRIRRRHLVAALVAASLAVNALGIGVNFFHYIQALRDRDKVHDEWNYIPNLSPIRFHAHVVADWFLGVVGAPPRDFTYKHWCDGILREEVIPMEGYSRSGLEPDLFFFRTRDTAVERAGLAVAGLLVAAAAVLAGARVRTLLVEGPT